MEKNQNTEKEMKKYFPKVMRRDSMTTTQEEEAPFKKPEELKELITFSCWHPAKDNIPCNICD